MNRANIVKLFCDLNSVSIEETSDKFLEVYEVKVTKTFQELNSTYDDICKSIPNITSLYFSIKKSIEWQFISLNFYLLELLNKNLNESKTEVLSVQQSRNLKSGLKNLVTIGIKKNLQPSLPHFEKIEAEHIDDIFFNYNILKCTSYGLYLYLKYPNLRLLILPDSLQDILVAFYQISFCPLKKPDSNDGNNKLTEEIYTKLVQEKEVFKQHLEELKNNIHPAIFVKETMAIFESKSPVWFKKSVSQTLTNIIRSKNGVENISIAMLDGSNNDSTKTWKILDVISKLILSCRNFPDFHENICKQLTNLLDKVRNEDELIFERIFVYCTKSLLVVDENLCKTVFVRRILLPLLHLTYKEHDFQNDMDITIKINQSVRLIHAVFIEKNVDLKNLPLDHLKSLMNIIFILYSVTINSTFKSTNNDLKDILLKYLKICNQAEVFKLFDSFLFSINSDDILQIRNDLTIHIIDNAIVLKESNISVKYPIADNSNAIMILIKNNTDLLLNLFRYLLNCLCERDKYFKKASDDLLKVEPALINEYIVRNLEVYKLLSILSEDKNVQEEILENPIDIIRYINNILVETIKSDIHKTSDFESEGFQTIFTVIMILQAFVNTSTKNSLKEFKTLIEPLQIIGSECNNDELKELLRKILKVLEGGKIKNVRDDNKISEKTELEKAIEDVCDPLLPVRGHGLMTLAKLVEKKDKNVLERKNYILNIFQQNLKNDDSFIYLSAIGGLAAMADIFTDIVINILCEEYSDFSKKSEGGEEIRMKLGEVLVRTTKLLGDMAPKYKAVLLNTFLVGTKDDDHLIRASSLSNLGEICRVLGYKLGTIITEVLVCVHSIIATDKSLEARRAAVTVIRQLFVGLESEMISFLKDDILPIYRTLKQIYNNDADDVMRLQAQLALEELNENMKNFVLPKPELNLEKKIIMLN